MLLMSNIIKPELTQLHAKYSYSCLSPILPGVRFVRGFITNHVIKALAAAQKLCATSKSVHPQSLSSRLSTLKIVVTVRQIRSPFSLLLASGQSQSLLPAERPRAVSCAWLTEVQHYLLTHHDLHIEPFIPLDSILIEDVIGPEVDLKDRPISPIPTYYIYP